MDNNIKKQSEDLVCRLQIVRDEFKRMEQELNFSVRRDVVSVELKEIIANSDDYASLKSAIETYIKNLI